MSPRWDGSEALLEHSIGPVGWLRVLFRGVALALLVTVGLIVLMLIRLVERPLYGQGSVALHHPSGLPHCILDHRSAPPPHRDSDAAPRCRSG